MQITDQCPQLLEEIIRIHFPQLNYGKNQQELPHRSHL